MERLLLPSLVLMLVPMMSYSATIPSHLKEEGHKIIKRFSGEYDFEGHDIARVLHEKQPNSFHRIHRRDISSVVNSDDQSDFTNLRLELTNSNEPLRLKLKKRSIVDDDTEFVSNTKEGRVKRSASVKKDCFATGYEEGSPNEIASVSICDGLHGIVSTKGYDYYIHPVESEMAGGGHHVHVQWKRSTGEGSPTKADNYDEVFAPIDRVNGHGFQAWKHEDNFTIELALFTDARFWDSLQKIVPGREDEYMLVTMAAANALYGDKDKVGYDVNFKVRLIEHWEVDPEEYDFQEDLLRNLRSFCTYTTKKYQNPKYDMHFLHSKVTQQKGPVAGNAYKNGVCTHNRCGIVRYITPNRHELIAHEMGHNLGFRHHGDSKCPDQIKKISGGFMGGGLDFSPCNRWELQELFRSGKGACLFDTEGVEANLPRVFPGQSRSPDKLCELYAGFEYTYFRLSDLIDDGACKMFMCRNTNETSPGYQSVIQMKAPHGFPCGEEKFCSSNCQPWIGSQSIGWDVDYLRSFKQNYEWSSWPQEWSECSSTCGNGVQVKERECLIDDGIFVSPYCKGSDNIKARLCAQTLCDGEPETAEELRKTRADKMCASFHGNDVQLSSKINDPYLPVSVQMKYKKYFSPNCLVSCQRENGKGAGADGILVDGTPCPDATRHEYDLQRFGIEMRCAKGRCLEFSDCLDNEPKDKCGVCTNAEGYDGNRCVSKTISEDLVDLSHGDKFVLATLPAGSARISVRTVNMRDARLEMWTGDGSELVWGKGGQFPKKNYLNDMKVDYAGTLWSLHHKHYVRAEGPIDASVMLKVIVGTSPYVRLDVCYILP